MSGIGGIYNRDRVPVNNEDIKRMIASVPHRGQGKAISSANNQIVLIQHSLHGTPNSAQDKLQLVKSTSSARITLHGRIDNKDELILKLSLKDDDPNRLTDPEIILKAYERWGTSCPKRIIGDFAFAIWDKDRLFCARDALGIKPFYYYLSNKKFIFSSEIDQILACAEVPFSCNKKYILNQINDQYPDRESTLVNGINRLPAAHTLTVSEKSLSKNKYWDPCTITLQKYHSIDEYSEQFIELFTSVIDSMLQTSSTKIGVLLSGGLDSSSVVCGLKKVMEDKKPFKDVKIEGLSLSFPDLDCDEKKSILEFSNLIGPDHINLNFHNHESIDIDTALQQIATSCAVPNTIIGFAYNDLFKLANKHDISTVFGGWGADDWLGAHPCIYKDAYKNSSGLLIMKRFIYDVNRLGFRYASQILKSYLTKPMLKDILKTLKIRRNDSDSLKCSNYTVQSKYDWLNSGMFAQNAELQERALSLYGLEGRYPYNDRRIVEFGFSLDPIHYMKYPMSKPVIREGLKKFCYETNTHRFSDPEGSLIYWKSLKKIFDQGKYKLDTLVDTLSLTADYTDTLTKDTLADDKYIAYKHTCMARNLGNAFTMNQWLEAHSCDKFE